MKHDLGPHLAPGEEDKQIARIIGTCLRCGKKGATIGEDDCHGVIVPSSLPHGRMRDVLEAVHESLSRSISDTSGMDLDALKSAIENAHGRKVARVWLDDHYVRWSWADEDVKPR